MSKRGGECLLSPVDRKSRFTPAVKLPKGTAEAARDAIAALLGGLPEDKAKSVTPTVVPNSRCIRRFPMPCMVSRFTSPLHSVVPTKTRMPRLEFPARNLLQYAVAFDLTTHFEACLDSITAREFFPGGFFLFTSQAWGSV